MFGRMHSESELYGRQGLLLRFQALDSTENEFRDPFHWQHVERSSSSSPSNPDLFTGSLESPNQLSSILQIRAVHPHSNLAIPHSLV